MTVDPNPEPIDVAGRVVVLRTPTLIVAPEDAAAWADFATRLHAAGAWAVIALPPGAWVETYVVECPKCSSEATLGAVDEAGR